MTGGRKNDEGRLKKALATTLVFFVALLPLTTLAQATDEIPALRPALPEIAPTVWEQHGVLIIVLSVLALVLAGVLIWWLLQPKPVVPVPIEIQTRRELEALSREPESGKMLSRLSQCLRKYFAGAFGLPTSEMTTTEFSRALQANQQVGGELMEAVADFLRQADERKFAPGAGVGNGAVRQAIELVERGEQRRVELRQAAVVK